MTYSMLLDGKRVLANIQYSKLGFGYPRLFIELSDELYANVDVTINAVFPMLKEDFEEWAEDAIPVENGEEFLRTEYGIKTEALIKWMRKE